jgi:serine protease AprX
VLVVCAGTDNTLTELRSLILSVGGSIHFQFLSVNALSVVLPASQVLTIAQRPEVVSISPNLQTQRSGELLEDTTGASIARLTNTTESISPTLDGSGIGVAVLDSGIMKNHQAMLNSSGESRVKYSVDFGLLHSSKILTFAKLGDLSTFYKPGGWGWTIIEDQNPH